jgi:hypothetical protein
MASLTRYFQRPTVEVDMLSPAAADQGQGAIGQGISSVAGNIARVQERDDNFWVQKTLSELESGADQDWVADLDSVQDGAEGFTQSHLSRLDRRYSSARAAAPSRRAEQALELGIMQQRRARENRAVGFEKEEKFSFRQRTIEREVDNLGQHAQRNNGVEPYSPQGRLTVPGTLDSEITRPAADGFYQSDSENPANVPGFQSAYYSPRDFADGANMQDRSGEVKISKRLVERLDWVTDQFGMGKLQINSGYRSPSSNLRRASSGADGPHTHGESVDIQVRDLNQQDKNRLYSLLKAQGFNAFGFGEGVLHAEIRPGEGNGRGGDHEWTYGNASKYQLMPVAAPGQATTTAPWRTPNQYPFLAAATLTARGETGTGDLAQASSVIAPDANGTVSYGVIGLNSGGTLQRFISEHPDLGIEGRPGSPEFDESWRRAARRNPQKMVDAQLRFHEQRIVRPAQRQIVSSGLGRLSNDPRAVAFVSDMVVQYGAGGVEKHLNAAAGARTVEEMVEATSASMRSTLNQDFKSALGENPGLRAGLLARIDKRAAESLALAADTGIQSTGNVPAWHGPLPDINDVPMYRDRLDRIDAMVDSIGGTPEQRRTIRDNMESQVTRAWLASVAETNPSAAMAVLHSGKYDDVLSLQDDAALRSVGQSGWQQYEQEIRTAHRQLLDNLKTEAQSYLADEVASIRTTGQSQGNLSDAHMAMLSNEDREGIDLARFEYDINKQVSGARNDQLPAILESLEPDGDGFALEQKKYQYAQELIAQRREQQMNDPAGYVISTQPAVAEAWQGAVASGDPQRMQGAISLLRRWQKEQGIPESRQRSITQSHSEGNQAVLNDAEDPDQAFARLVELRRLYGPESAAVFSEMEQDGGRRGWKEVNELMDGGNFILAKSLSRVVHADEYAADIDIGMRLARNGQPGVARTIFDGRLRRKEVSGILPTGQSDDGRSIDGIIGETIGDALDYAGPVQGGVMEAARSYYANSAAMGEPLDAAKMEDAVRQVTGGILTHNDSGRSGYLIAPVPGMTQTQFDSAIMRVQDKDLAGAFVGFSETPEPVTAWSLENEMQLVPAGNGRYYLRYPGAGLARTEQGTPFELDMLSLLPKLGSRQAREDEFMGGDPGSVEDNANAFRPGGTFSNFDAETGRWLGGDQR